MMSSDLADFPLGWVVRGDYTWRLEVLRVSPLEHRDAQATTAVESLLFELSGQRFALPLTAASEVVRAVAVRKLPAIPSIVLGIIDVRGEIVPVLDVRVRFGFPHKPVEPEDQFLIGQAGRRRIALQVDRALGLAPLSMLTLARASNLPASISRLAGVAATSEGLVLIHDLETFLTQAENDALEIALAAESAAE